MLICLWFDLQRYKIFYNVYKNKAEKSVFMPLNPTLATYLQIIKPLQREEDGRGKCLKFHKKRSGNVVNVKLKC